MPGGTGPRELVRRPDSDLCYVVGELAGVVLTVREDPAGTFTVVGSTSATAGSYQENLAAHLEITPRGPYVSSRGPDCVTSLDEHVDHPCGAWPRHFRVLDERAYVAAQRDHALVSFGLDEPGEVTTYPVGSPTCVAPAP